MKKATTQKKDSGLTLTKISIYPIKKKGITLKANVDITFNDLLVCKGFKVIESDKGLFVSKPSQKGSDGKYYDQVYILSKSEWDEIEEIILEEYEKADN